MAAACTPVPTSTLFEVVTTTTTSTSISDILTTIPEQLTTSTSSECLLSTTDANGTISCLTSTEVEVTSTIQPAITSTIETQVPFQVILTTSSPTATLFSTCPTGGSTTTNTSTTLPPTTSAAPTNATVITSAAASTLANGSVVFVTYTSTSFFSSSAAPTTQAGDSSKHSSADDALGPIIGGALGGFVGLILFGVLAWFIWRKKDRLRDIYTKDHMPNFEPSMHASWIHRSQAASPPPGPEPKPYEYGLVGHKADASPPSRGSSTSRPQSLTLDHTNAGAASPSPSQNPFASPAFPSPAAAAAGAGTQGDGAHSPYAPGFALYPPLPDTPHSAHSLPHSHGHLPPSPYAPAFAHSAPPTPGTGSFGLGGSSAPPTPTPGHDFRASLPPPPRPPTPGTALVAAHAQQRASFPPASPSFLPSSPSHSPPTPPQAQAQAGGGLAAPVMQHAGPAASATSLGTAVSYPYPVLPRYAPDDADEDEDGRAGGAGGAGDGRRPTRMSLTLANWNPETDGELFPRASEDEGAPEGGSVRRRRGTVDEG